MKERVFIGIRANLMASIPLLSHFLFLPLLVFAITHFRDHFHFTYSERTHKLFLKLESQTVADHLQSYFLFFVNIFCLSLHESFQEEFTQKVFGMTLLFIGARLDYIRIKTFRKDLLVDLV